MAIWVQIKTSHFSPTSVYQMIHGSNGLLHGCGGIWPMAEDQIHICQAHPLQGALHPLHQMFPGKSSVIHPVATIKELGGDHQVAPKHIPWLEEMFQGLILKAGILPESLMDWYQTSEDNVKTVKICSSIFKDHSLRLLNLRKYYKNKGSVPWEPPHPAIVCVFSWLDVRKSLQV